MNSLSALGAKELKRTIKKRAEKRLLQNESNPFDTNLCCEVREYGELREHKRVPIRENTGLKLMSSPRGSSN